MKLDSFLTVVFFRVLCLLLIQSHQYASITTQDYMVNFSSASVEIDVKTHQNLRIICPDKSCYWILANKSSSLVTFNVSLHALTLLSGADMDRNYTVCSDSQHPVVSGRPIQLVSLPLCCPCCVWYLLSSCRLPVRHSNDKCSTISVYYRYNISSEFSFDQFYNNTAVLIPCRQRLSGLRDNLRIFDRLNKDRFSLKIENGSKTANTSYIFFYHPTVGLCLNSRNLKQSTFIECHYLLDDEVSHYKFDFIKLSHNSLVSEFILTNNHRVSINGSTLAVLDNDFVDISCRANFKFRFSANVVCVKVSIGNRVVAPIKCSTSQFNVRNVGINTKLFQNNTKISCHSEDPSRILRSVFEAYLVKFPQPHLSLSPQKLYDRFPITINASSTVYQFQINYRSVPSYQSVKCEPISDINEDYKVSCDIERIGRCDCDLNINHNAFKSLLHNFSVNIFNNDTFRMASFLLRPVYLEKPTIVGLSSHIERYKMVNCNVSVSRPFTVVWHIKLDGSDMYNNQTNRLQVVVPINDSVQTICARCTITNELGSLQSNEVCQTLIDAEIHPNKSLEIMLENAYMWKGGVIFRKLFNFASDSDVIVDVMDTNPLTVKCVSRLKDFQIQMFLNDKILVDKVQDIKSNYTRRIVLSIKPDQLRRANFSGVYQCRQTTKDNRVFLDKSYTVRILRSISPEFQTRRHTLNQRYIDGQNVHFNIGLREFPLSSLTFFRILRDGNNSNSSVPITSDRVSYSVQRRNRTVSHCQIVFRNVSQFDGGTYLVLARNARGSDSVQFNLETVGLNDRRFGAVTADSVGANRHIYMAAAIVFVVAAMLAATVAAMLWCRRWTSLVPIVQIRNHLYRRVDLDSTQMLTAIWPDPADRARWTIPARRLRIHDKIGGGNYGIVYRGSFCAGSSASSSVSSTSSSDQMVALKQPILTRQQDGSKTQQFCQVSWDCFVNEVRLLAKIGGDSDHVVRMLGCSVWHGDMEPSSIIAGSGSMLLVLEFCPNRSLKEFLQTCAPHFRLYTKTRTSTGDSTNGRVDHGITLLDLKKLALGIATGLEYLASHSIIHRDLATRNVLLDSNRVPRISDFGLAIELDEQKQQHQQHYRIITMNKALPFRILAPESLETRLFYLESDIWALSLLFWEMFNLSGSGPFPEVSSPRQLSQLIHSRTTPSSGACELLPIPQFADEPVWRLIRSCWLLDPLARPSAASVRASLLQIVRSSPLEIIRVDPASGTANSPSSPASSTSTSIVTLNYSGYRAPTAVLESLM